MPKRRYVRDSKGQFSSTGSSSASSTQKAKPDALRTASGTVLNRGARLNGGDTARNSSTTSQNALPGTAAAASNRKAHVAAALERAKRARSYNEIKNRAIAKRQEAYQRSLKKKK